MDWDFVLNPSSSQAAIYVAWEKELQGGLFDYFPDPKVQGMIGTVQMGKLIPWILDPENKFGQNARVKRDEYLMGTLTSAVKTLAEKFGDI